MYYTDFKNNTQKLVNNYRTTQPLNDRTVLAYFVPTTAPTTAPPIILTTNGTDTVTTTVTVTTTDSAYGVSENSFLFLASLCLVLLSFLEIWNDCMVKMSQKDARRNLKTLFFQINYYRLGSNSSNAFNSPCITEINAQNNLVVVLILKKINTQKTVFTVIIYIVIETRQEVWA